MHRTFLVNSKIVDDSNSCNGRSKIIGRVTVATNAAGDGLVHTLAAARHGLVVYVTKRP